MVWETWYGDDVNVSQSERPPILPQKRKEGDLITLIGSSNGINMEKIYGVNNELLGYSLGDNKVLLRISQNDRDFDQYITLPFTKGVTERGTGRTLLILGSSAHHIEAMQNQFDSVLWRKNDLEEIKGYGDTIRWINVGNIKTGFIGLDYKPNAKNDEGVANSLKDIGFLARTLLDLGYDPKKRLFLLKPPYIVESDKGKEFRRNGLETLANFQNIK